MHQNSESSDASIGEVSYGAAIQLHHLQVATASSSGCRRELARGKPIVQEHEKKVRLFQFASSRSC